MRWTYLVVTKNEPRAEMRVFQVVDQQQAPILAFSGLRVGDQLCLTLVVEADESRAKRIEALLYNLHPILSVKVITEGQDRHELQSK